MDTEEFLSSLQVYYTGSGQYTFFTFRVVTQKYGKGIVQYGRTTQTSFPSQVLVVRTTTFVMLRVNIYFEVDFTIRCMVQQQLTDTQELISAVSDHSRFTYRIYATLEFEDAIGEVSFDLEAVTVSVTERKLRAQWSPELAQDVSAFHNIDAEAELTALLSEQVAAEIDREILRDLRKGAAWTLRWDYNGWKRVSNASVNLQPKGLESNIDYCNQSDFCSNP